MEPNQILAGLLGQAGMSAVLAWFLWWLLSKSIPDMMSQFRADIRDMREEARLERNEERTQRKQENTLTLGALDRLGTRLERMSEVVEHIAQVVQLPNRKHNGGQIPPSTN